MEKHAICLRRAISDATPAVALASTAAQTRVDYEYIP